MGRYTTSQTFSDRDNNAALPYAAAKGLESADAKNAIAGGGDDANGGLPTGFGKGNGADARAKSGGGSSSDRLEVNKVSNAYGSTAGASSGDYHLYRAHRRSELFRLEKMDSDHSAKLENEAFQLKLRQNEQEAIAQTQRRANKRKRKKLAKQEARKKHQEEGKTITTSNNTTASAAAAEGGVGGGSADLSLDSEANREANEEALKKEVSLLQESAEAKQKNVFADNGGYLDGVRAMNSLLSRLKE
jgi:hypothetical protein